MQGHLGWYNVHVVLFGADEGEIEFPDMDDRMNHVDETGTEETLLEAFSDVDSDEFDAVKPGGVSKAPWGEGSKRAYKDHKG